MKNTKENRSLVIKELTDKGYECGERTVRKNGVAREGIEVTVPNVTPNVGMIVYIDDFSTDDVAGVVEKVSSLLSGDEYEKHTIAVTEFNSSLRNRDALLNGVRVYLRNREKLEEDSLTKPLPEVYNNADYVGVLYYVEPFGEGDKSGYAKTLLTPHILEGAGVSEEEAWAYAFKHLEEDFLSSDVVAVMLEITDLPKEEVISIEKAKGMTPMPIFTNKDKYNGASAIFLVDKVRNVLEFYGLDKAWLIPSSIHEFLVAPGDIPFEEVKTMIVSANDEVVDDLEVLGDTPILFSVA
jgi:hypothetical protein